MKAEERSFSDLNEPLAPRRTRLEEFWRLFRKNRLATAGMVIFVVFFLTALVGLFLTYGRDPVFDPARVRLTEKLRPPLSKPRYQMVPPDQVPPLGIYLFGTDNLGRDVFARMLQGAWVSLTVGFVAVGISILVGIIMGGIAGYFGHEQIRFYHLPLACIVVAGTVSLGAGFFLVFSFKGSSSVLTGFALAGLGLFLFGTARRANSFLVRKARGRASLPLWLRLLRREITSVDAFIVRIVDIMLCFPSFFLILTVVALLPASIYNIMIVIGLTSWMGTTRFVRAEFLSLREQDFVTAAKALAVSDLRIIFRHMMPNAIAPVLVSATIGIASAILVEAALSFLGFGVPPPDATWGNILSDGKRFIFDAPWLTFIPGFAILIVVLAFNLFGEGLRDVLNPRLRERHG